VQVSEKVKGTKKNGVLRDRDCWLQGWNTRRKKGTSGKGDKVQCATTFGRFEDNLHYSRGKFLPWRVNGSLGPEIRIYHFLFFFFRPPLPPERSENTNRRECPLFCH